MLALAPPALDVISRPVAALVARYGVPSRVASSDDGQHVVFSAPDGSVDAIIDDDATVHAVATTLRAGTSYALPIEGTSHRFVYGGTTSLAARDELAADAETEGDGYRVFRADARTFVALFFDAKTGTLARVLAGDRGAFVRLGLLPDPRPIQQRFPYVAPVLRRSAVADGAGPEATIVRVDLDRRGGVHNVAIVVPSADAAFDASLAARLAKDAYAPAKLGGRAIGASVFRELRH